MNTTALPITTVPTMNAINSGKSYKDLSSLMSDLDAQMEMLLKQKEELSVELAARKEQAIANYHLHSNQHKEAYRLMMEDERILIDMDIDPTTILSEQNTDCSELEETVDEACAFNSSNATTKLKPIVVWPGGKTKELKHIIPNLPSYNRFFEPFVGGGSVFMGLNAQEHHINDFSGSLINIYRNIGSSNEQFFHYLQEIDMSLDRAQCFSHKHQDTLANIFEQYRTGSFTKKETETAVSKWCSANHKEILDIIGEFKAFPCTLIREIENYLMTKFNKQIKNKDISAEWLYKHIEAAIAGGVYKNLCAIYNNKEIEEQNPSLHAAVMVYIRQFCFSGMFKYDKKGNFNSNFGGIGYLNKRLQRNINRYKSEEVVEHFKSTQIYNYDFEEFLTKANPQKNDFIFLDPPYDCPFTKYDGNDFGKEDHKRLANYLLTKCKAKWMMIINKTDFIYDLYNQPNIHIQEYGKTYTCDAKYNEKRDAIHLLITNYDVNAQQSAKTQSWYNANHKAVIATVAAQCKKLKKSRNKYKWVEIQQLTIDGKYLRSWDSISEASKTLNLNHASISKCVNGHYKTAEGFKWVGIPSDTDEAPMAAAA